MGNRLILSKWGGDADISDGIGRNAAPARGNADGFLRRSGLTSFKLGRCFRPAVFAPLVRALRAEGIRTEVVASATNLASDLRRAAYSMI